MNKIYLNNENLYFFNNKNLNLIFENNELRIKVGNLSENIKKELFSFGFFPIYKYPLYLYKDEINIIKLKFKIISDNKDIEIKFYDGTKYIKLNIDNNNYVNYNGFIKFSKKNRIGFKNFKSNTIIKISDFLINYNLKVFDNDLLKMKLIRKHSYNELIKYKFLNTNKIIDFFKNDFVFMEKNFFYLIKCKNAINLYDVNSSVFLRDKKLIIDFDDVYKNDEIFNNNFNYQKETIENNIENIDYVSENLFYAKYQINNYLHFIRDTLPHIFVYLEIRKINNNIKLLLHDEYEKLPNYVTDIFKYLNIQNNCIYTKKDSNVTVFKNLYIGINKTIPIDQKIIHKYFKISSYNIEKKKCIYISRRIRKNINLTNVGECNYYKRQLINELEFENILKNKYNFEIIWAEDLNIKQKIDLFNRCKIIVYCQGSFDVNKCFINNCKFIKILSSDPRFITKDGNSYKIDKENIRMNSVNYVLKKCGYIPNCNKIKNIIIKYYNIDSNIINNYFNKLSTNNYYSSENLELLYNIKEHIINKTNIHFCGLPWYIDINKFIESYNNIINIL